MAKRILSLAPSNTGILYELGLGDNIIAVTPFCSHPEAKNKPQIRGWIDINQKLIEKYKPDIIVTATRFQNKIIERLEKLGVKILHVDPVTLEDVFVSIQLLGYQLDRQEDAERLVTKLKNHIKDISDRVTVKNKPKVYCEEWASPNIVSGNWIPEIIELAGGESMCPKGMRSYKVTVDEIKKFNPDVITALWNTKKYEILSRHEWRNIKAIKERNVHVLDNSLLYPGPRVVQGFKDLAKILHPEVRIE